jgi:Beta-lactamase enzyme family
VTLTGWRSSGAMVAAALLVTAVAVGAVALVRGGGPFRHPIAMSSPPTTNVTARPATTSPATTSARPATTSAHTSPPVRSTAPVPPAAVAAVERQMRALTAQVPPGGVSVAALNTATGAEYRYGATGGMLTGSVVKLEILETLLLQHQDRGTQLTDDETGTARTMIENSDNDAAEVLYYAIGGRDGLVASGPRLALTHTIPGPKPDFKGLTRTSAADCIVLLENLLRPAPLHAYARSLVLAFMRNVEADQRWGVGVVADPGTTFANKNGWLSVDEDNPDGLGDNDRWLVNSVGIATVHHQQVLMAVLTQHGPDYASGVQLVEALARAITPAVVTR